jgi:hypothetical protein
MLIKNILYAKRQFICTTIQPFDTASFFCKNFVKLCPPSVFYDTEPHLFCKLRSQKEAAKNVKFKFFKNSSFILHHSSLLKLFLQPHNLAYPNSTKLFHPNRYI